jgi:hypothetical protein
MGDGQNGGVVATLPQTAPHRSARRASRRWWSWPVLVAVGYLAVQVVLGPAAVVYPDTARYGSMALEFRGVPKVEAEAAGSAMLCADRGEQAARTQSEQTLPIGTPVDPAAVEAQCVAAAGGHLEPTDNPRYTAIFDTRPGYPLAVAVVVPLLGLKGALWAVPVTATLLAGLLVWLLLRELGASPQAAAAGQLLLYVLPVGWWGSQMLTEGPILAGVVAAVLGAVWLTHGQRTAGAAMLVIGLTVVAAVKYSTALPLGAALGAVAVAGWWLRGVNKVGAGLVAATGAASTAMLLWLSHAMGWPSIGDTAQDLFAVHFTRPDVPDVTGRLVAADEAYWSHWLLISPLNGALLAGLVVCGAVLTRRAPMAALFVGAAAAAGVVLTAAHPDVFEGDRLYALAWLVAVVGVPLCVSAPQRKETPRPQP